MLTRPRELPKGQCLPAHANYQKDNAYPPTRVAKRTMLTRPHEVQSLALASDDLDPGATLIGHHVDDEVVLAIGRGERSQDAGNAREVGGGMDDGGKVAEVAALQVCRLGRLVLLGKLQAKGGTSNET